MQGVYDTWQKEQSATNSVLAQSQTEIEKYNAVLAASPQEIDKLISSFGLLGIETSETNDILAIKRSIIQGLQEEYINLYGVESEVYSQALEMIDNEIAKQNEKKDTQIANNSLIRQDHSKLVQHVIKGDEQMAQSFKKQNEEQKRRETELAAYRKKVYDDSLAIVRKYSSDAANASAESAKGAATNMMGSVKTMFNDSINEVRTSVDAIKRYIDHMQLAKKTLQIEGVYVGPAGISNGGTGVYESHRFAPIINSGGYGDINLETKITVNGNPDIKAIRQWGRQIAEVVDTELGRKVRRK